MSDRLLKTKQVAELLDLSDSTVKRLVNSGHLKAIRTEGKHRLIPMSEVVRYQEKLRRGLERETASDDVPVMVAGRIGTAVEKLVQALKKGEGALVQALFLRAFESGIGTATLADDLIRPAMERIGHDWEHGRIEVYEEHRASRIIEMSLMELVRRVPAPQPHSPLALGATPEGDLYTITGLLCELALREQGWDVVNLGSNLPLASLSRAIRIHQPRLVWLSVSHLADPDQFVEEYNCFYDSVSRTGTAIILGGSALGSELRSQVVAASFGDRLSHLCEFARTIEPRSLPAAEGSTDRSNLSNL